MNIDIKKYKGKMYIELKNINKQKKEKTKDKIYKGLI